MIWEFDEDLDGRITLREFERTYKICMMDRTAAEPKKLFHLIQFLMYCSSGSFEIAPENTYEL
jgi:Ca2+-binding EF-hand superfamily protein